MKPKIKILLTGLCFSLITSCSMLMTNNDGKNSISSSLMDFLYPNKESRLEHQAEIPVLRLPVTVGIAFVPSKNTINNEINSSNQIALLEQVKKSFIKYNYIDRIEIIPGSYLKGGQGFETLEQVSRLYDVDLMALVSYDQVSQTVENNAALLYWTIVGMYLIPGNENTIQTFVDTAVFDVKSRKMLFRAPGINKTEKLSTAVGINDTLATNSYQGFNLAVQDMTSNLDAGLAGFRTRVKEEKIANIEHKKGYSGGGSMGYLSLFLILIFFRRYCVS